MKTPVTLLLFTAVVCGGPLVRAVDPSSAGTIYAYFYQREVRAALAARSWHVSEDKTGELVADRTALAEGGPADSFQLEATVELNLSFRREGAGNLVYADHATLRIYSDGPIGGRREAFEPRRFGSPKLAKDLQDIMTEAQTRLAKEHPQYAAREPAMRESEETIHVNVARK